MTHFLPLKPREHNLLTQHVSEVANASTADSMNKEDKDDKIISCRATEYYSIN